MKTKSDIFNIVLLDYSNFLDEVGLLRQQKGKYLCTDFCAQLEKLSDKIIKTIFLDFGFKHTISNKFQHSEKISNNLIELCLECIEIDLQKIQSSNNSPQIPLEAQSLQILIGISCDIRYLAACIKFTMDSDSSSAPISITKANNYAGSQIQQF